MITQKYMQGRHEIKIETAESIDDAKKNDFKEGEYSRYFVNNQLSNYMTLIRFIVEETQNSKSSLIPDGKRIEELRQQMLTTQNNEMMKNLEGLKKQYAEMGVPDSVMKDVNGMIKKVNEYGVRVVR